MIFDKFGFSGKSDFFRDLGDRVGKGLFIISTIVGSLVLAVCSAVAGSNDIFGKLGETSGFLNLLYFLSSSPSLYLLLAAALFLIIGGYGTYHDQSKQHDKMEDLKRDNSKLQKTREALNAAQEEVQESKSKVSDIHKSLVETWLKAASKHLKLCRNSRITIYYEYDEEFYLLSRHSDHPSYTKEHRQKFPLNQGVISKAWENGTFKEDECPSADDQEKYCSYMEKEHGYNKEKIEQLTMKSCRYYGRDITDADIGIGVILFESTETNFFDDDLDRKIEDYCKSHEGQLSKCVRDGILFSKEVNIKKEGREVHVEDDLLGEAK